LLHDENGSLLPPGLLLDRVSDLLTQRSAIYEQAHITVTIDAASTSSVVARIQGALRQ
jgi:shikimate kinase